MIRGACHCGQLTWTFDGMPDDEGATACNCTLCRRYGALWIYDYENEKIRLDGRTASYTRVGKSDPSLEILFCPVCAGVAAWRGLRPAAQERRRMAVNLRLAEPSAEVSAIPIRAFDGLDTFEDTPHDGRCVRDLWA